MKKKVIALILAVLMVVSCAPFGMAYTTEAMQAATHLNQLGLFAGSGTNPDGSPNFDLDAKPTRVQGIVMLLALMGERSKATSAYTSPFTDVPGWAKNYVNYAYTKKYTGGVSSTRFGTNNPVTSNQYLTFVLAAMGYSSRTDFNWKDPFTLSDSLGITSGEYNANSKFTRGDMCIISYNALNAKIKGSDKTLMEVLTEKGVIKDTQITPTPEPTPKPFNLDGEWIQSNRGDPDVMYHRAFISDGTIEIYWYDPVEKKSYLYWAGTIDTPNKDSNKFSWESQNDTEKTSTALLASGSPTKIFTYEKSEIKYEASAFGVTALIYLKKVK